MCLGTEIQNLRDPPKDVQPVRCGADVKGYTDM